MTGSMGDGATDDPSSGLSENELELMQVSFYIVYYPVMLCYIILHHVMSYYVMLCYVMSCHVMSCYVMLWYVILCYVMLCHVMSCHVGCSKWYQLMLCLFTSYHVFLSHVMWLLLRLITPISLFIFFSNLFFLTVLLLFCLFPLPLLLHLPPFLLLLLPLLLFSSYSFFLPHSPTNYLLSALWRLSTKQTICLTLDHSVTSISSSVSLNSSCSFYLIFDCSLFLTQLSCLFPI